MRSPSLPTSAIVFHAVALVFFCGCAVALVRAGQVLGGRRGMIDLAVAVAAGGLALLSLLTVVALLRARSLTSLHSRAEVGAYVQVLAVLGGLGLVGTHLLSTEERQALGTFCLGLAGWLCGIGLHLVPSLFLGDDGFVDHLGRRTRFSELEWFILRGQKSEPPRVLLQAGSGTSLRLMARLSDADASVVRGRLLQAGVPLRS